MSTSIFTLSPRLRRKLYMYVRTKLTIGPKEVRFEYIVVTVHYGRFRDNRNFIHYMLPRES